MKKFIMSILVLALLGFASFFGYTYYELKKAAITDLLRNGNTWQIKGKIAIEPDINKLHNGVTSLMFATLTQKDIDIFNAFLKAGADVNIKGDKGITALMLASSVQSADVINLLLNAGADVNAVSDEGFTALVFAADNNQNPDIIRLLSDAGGDINFSNDQGKSVLLSAAINNRNPNVLRQVIDSGAHIDEPLLMSLIVSKINAEAIKVFIEKGINVNYQDPERFTPLLLAISEAFSTETVKLLIEAGANVNTPYQGNLTPLMVAAQRPDESLAMKIIKMSGKTIEDPEYDEMRDEIIKDQKTLEAVNLGIIQLLIDAGADINAVSDEGKTALDYAKESQKGTRVTDALTKAGATEKATEE